MIPFFPPIPGITAEKSKTLRVEVSSSHDLVLPAYRLTLNLKVESGKMPNWSGKGWGEETGGGQAYRVENVLYCVIRRKERGALLIFLNKSSSGRKQFIKTLHT